MIQLYDITNAMPDCFVSYFGQGLGWRYQVKFAVQILWPFDHKPEILTTSFSTN